MIGKMKVWIKKFEVVSQMDAWSQQSRDLLLDPLPIYYLGGFEEPIQYPWVSVSLTEIGACLTQFSNSYTVSFTHRTSINLKFLLALKSYGH